MKKLIYILLVSSFTASACAAELTEVKAADIKAALDPALPAAVACIAAPEKASRAYQNVFMQIRSQPSWGAVEASDFQLRVDISVRKVFNDQYDMYNRVDNETQMGSIRKVFNSDWQLSGYGSYLDMREFGGSYTISGRVPGQGSQSTYINLNASKRFDDFSYFISGIGVNLSVDQYGVNGSYDSDRFSKQAFTAVLSMIFAAQANKTPAGR